MKKWFNTNYHYLVPELSDNTEIKLVGDQPFVEYEEAKAIGVLTKPVLIGGFTFLKLAKYKGSKTINDFATKWQMPISQSSIGSTNGVWSGCSSMNRAWSPI